MIDEFPLELHIQILTSLDVKELIKSRAVNKRWRVVIDKYLFVELNIFIQTFPHITGPIPA